jgi:hypothetical protein
MRTLILAAGLVFGLGGTALAYDGRDMDVGSAASVQAGDPVGKLARVQKPGADVGATDHEDDDTVTGSLYGPGDEDEVPAGVAGKPWTGGGFDEGTDERAEAAGKPVDDETYARRDAPDELSTGSIDRSQDATDKPSSARAPIEEDEGVQGLWGETSKPDDEAFD